MSYIPSAPDKIAFSTSVLLGNGATYSSGVLSLIGYTQVQTDVLSNVDGTVTISFLEDAAGTVTLRTLTIPYTGGSGYQMFSAPAFTPYVKYQFTANAAGQTSFYFDTKFMTQALSGQVLGLDAFVSPSMVANLGRNILVGKTTGGNSYQNVNIDAQANLEVSVASPLTAFGEMNVAASVPVVQVDFVYGINDVTTQTAVTGSGTAGGSSGLLELATTAAASSSAIAYTSRNLKYRPGQGALARFTALFTTGVANSVQYAGVGFPDLQDGLFFGYEGASFGISYIRAGSTTHIAQADWNVDNMGGAGGSANPSGETTDPTNGNVFQIKYQYLGFGDIFFFIESANTGNFVLVHIIKYANTYTTPSLTNPSMPLIWAAVNTSNTSNIQVKAGSGMAAVEGLQELLGPRHGASSVDTAVTTEIAAFSFKNCTTFNTVQNGGLVRIRTVTFGSNSGGAGSGITFLRMIKNTTLGGTPVFTPHDGSTSDNGVTITSGNSVVSVDTDGTTVTGGNGEYVAIVAVGNSMSADVTELNLYLSPGETMTFSIESSQSATVGVGITWSEDL